MGYIGTKPSAVPLTSADITDGIIVNADISSTAGITLNKISGNPVFRNALINGDFSVAQRGTSFTSTSSANNDDTYTLDRWYILSDGNDAIDVTQETSVVPTNQLNAIALDVETINKKFGIAQIIEQKNCVGLIGNTVTLSFKAKVSATTKLDNVKCAIVAWSGTADTVTSDIISAWGAEGTNPTLIANATYENTPANLSVTTSYATYSVSAAIDTASTKNIIVFIWSDVTDTTLGDFLYVTDVQLEKGSAATDFEFLPIDVSLGKCQRYYQKHAGEGDSFLEAFYMTSGEVSQRTYMLPVKMRTIPSATLVGTWSISNIDGNSPRIDTRISSTTLTLAATSTSSARCFYYSSSSSQYIEISAEL